MVYKKKTYVWEKFQAISSRLIYDACWFIPAAKKNSLRSKDSEKSHRKWLVIKSFIFFYQHVIDKVTKHQSRPNPKAA
jgi:hypothetical protein